MHDTAAARAAAATPSDVFIPHERVALRCRRTWTYVNGYPVRLVCGSYSKAGYWEDKNRVHRSLEWNIRLTAQPPVLASREMHAEMQRDAAQRSGARRRACARLDRS